MIEVHVTTLRQRSFDSTELSLRKADLTDMPGVWVNIRESIDEFSGKVLIEQ